MYGIHAYTGMLLNIFNGLTKSGGGLATPTPQPLYMNMEIFVISFCVLKVRSYLHLSGKYAGIYYLTHIM